MDASPGPALIVGLFLVGPLVVVPLGLWLIPSPAAARAGRLLRLARLAALPAGLLLAAAFLSEPGPVPGLLAVPWLATATVAALAASLGGIEAIRDHRFLQAGTQHAVWASLAFLAVAAGNALADRLGVQPFGFAPVIILLTAVHFTFAGFVLVIVGTLAHAAAPTRLAAAGVAGVILGIPVTAVGFFGVEAAALGGALLVAAGGAAIGGTLLRLAATDSDPRVRWLRRLAGASLMLSMPLAVVYAVGAAVGTTWLDLPTMARTHGALNVVGFALPATLALAVERLADSVPGGSQGTAHVDR
jgi:hypothetical protein